MRFNPPPNWPPAPDGWTPPPGWNPDPSWGPPPQGWEFWVKDEPRVNPGFGGPPVQQVGGVGQTKPNWFAQHKVLTAIGGVIVLAIFVNALSNGNDEEPVSAAVPSETPTAEPSPEPTPTPSEPESEMASPNEAPTESSPPVEPPAGYGAYPADQQAFIDAFIQGKSRYDEASTELQRSVALTERDAQMCAVSGNGKMTNWSGKIVEIGANNDGLAHVEIEIADSVKVQTWNNAFSDLTDNTLIPTSAPFFGTLTALSEGDLVTFSAESVPEDTSCLKRANLTAAFYAIDPNFIVRVTDVRPQ